MVIYDNTFCSDVYNWNSINVKKSSIIKIRLDAKEKQKEQDSIVKLSGLMFIAGFIVAGCGVQFTWYVLPRSVVFVAAIVFL